MYVHNNHTKIIPKLFILFESQKYFVKNLGSFFVINSQIRALSDHEKNVLKNEISQDINKISQKLDTNGIAAIKIQEKMCHTITDHLFPYFSANLDVGISKINVTKFWTIRIVAICVYVNHNHK